MTKTIQQRLQSRIAKRRNLIRAVEEEVAMVSQQRRFMREDGALRDDPGYVFISNEAFEGRKFIKGLAADQKLDKQLSNLVTLTNSTRRHYGLSDC